MIVWEVLFISLNRKFIHENQLRGLSPVVIYVCLFCIYLLINLTAVLLIFQIGFSLLGPLSLIFLSIFILRLVWLGLFILLRI